MYDSILALSSLVSLSAAFALTSPTSDTILTPYNFTITWEKGETIDPAHVNIDLVNGASGPSRTIASNVSVNDYAYTMSPAQFNALPYISNGTDWQINVNSVPAEGSAFVAQSEQFTLHDVGDSAAAAASNPGSSSSSGFSTQSSSTSASSSGIMSSSSAAVGAMATSSGTSASSSTLSSSTARSSTASASASASSSVASSSSSGYAAAATGNMNLAAGGLLGVAAIALLT